MTKRDWQEWVLFGIMVLSACMVVVSVTWGMKLADDRFSTYVTSCNDIKGKAVFNGLHWECMK